MVKGQEAEFDASVDVSPESRIGVLSFKAITGNPELSAEFANAYARAFAAYLGGLQVDELKETLAPIQERINEIEAELPKLPAGRPATGPASQVELQALQEQIASQTSNPGDSMRIVEQAAPDPNAVAPKPKRDADPRLHRRRSCSAPARSTCATSSSTATAPPRTPPATSTCSCSARSRKGRDETAAGGLPQPAHGDGLRARTLRQAGDQPQRRTAAGTVLITGAESGCGKSYVSANVARTLATEGRRVTAVDGDLRRPTLHEIFKTALSPGLSDLLIERRRARRRAGVAVNVRYPAR